jgi:hypothetical protein
MPFFSQKSIEIIEYQNSSVTTKRDGLIEINNHTPLTFSSWELSVAMARTLFNEHISIPELYFDSVQALFNLPFLISRTNNNLRFNSNRIKRLRDFSRTNKIGEVAQALTWIYLEEKSSFPYVVDFELFCSKHRITIPANSSTPDFIAQGVNNTTNICIAESKGKLINSRTTIKTKLNSGLNQCDIGEIIVNSNGIYSVIKKLCFCSEFSRDTDIANSKFHFVDPEKPNKNTNIDDFIFRAHYANWFYLLGEFVDAEKLSKGEAIDFNDRHFTKEEIYGDIYWTTNLFDMILRTFDVIEPKYYYPLIIFDYFNDKKVKIGIADNVLQALKTKEVTSIDLKVSKSDNVLIFRDGTILTGITYIEDKNYL